MSSPFGNATQSSSSPVFNPFASKPQTQPNPFASGSSGASAFAKPNAAPTGFGVQSNKQAKANNINPFQTADGALSDGEGKRNVKNPFQSPDENLSDGSKPRKGRHEQGNQHDSKKSAFGGQRDGSNPFAKPTGRVNGRNTTAAGNTQSTSHAHALRQDALGPQLNLSDPFARKVYEQLHKDGISPPQWPSKPGDAQNKAEMAKFRERYDAYRDRVRTSLTRSGLIDDPEKRKTLQDAIDFRGICEDMCPEYEKVTRIHENDVPQPEKDPNTTVPSPSRMIKKLARSAAGQEAPLPMDVRSVPSLKRTLDYLIDDLLRNDGNLPVLHGFLWDRSRAIRRDFTFFSSLTPEELRTQVYVLENIARFHVTSLHLLSEDGKAPEDFVEQQELEQLGKCLLSLRDLYDDCSEQGIDCENEAEFRAFYLLFHANDPSILEILQRQWKSKFWKDSDLVRTAVSLVEALQNTNDFHGSLKAAPSLAASAAHHSYFRIVESASVSYTMACFAECHFPQLRRSILRAVKMALTRPKEATKDVTAADLNRFLRFDTVEEAIHFARLHDLEFTPDNLSPSDISRQHLILDNRAPLPHQRLQHQFSQRLVESKRGSRPLPEVIHRTVFSSGAQTQTQDGTREESLFVSEPDGEAIPPRQPSNSPQEKAQPSMFGWSQFGGGVSTKDKAVTEQPPALGLATTKTPFTSLSPSPDSSAPAVAKPAFGSTATPAPVSSAFDSVTAAKSPSPSPFFPSTGETPDVASFPSPFATKPPGQKQQGLDASLLSQSKFGQPDRTSLLKATGTQPAAPQQSKLFAEPGKPAQVPASSGVSNVPPAAFPVPSTSGTATSRMQTPPISTENVVKTPSVFQSTSMPPPPLPGNNAKPAASLFGLEKTPSTSQPSSPQPPPVSPQERRKKFFEDFTKWYVQGDKGLLEDFQIFMLEDTLRDCFESFVATRDEELRKEEEERNLALAEEFRVYNLSLKYFYRWKENARQKRLKELRRAGREQARAYHEAQRAAEQKSQKQAKRRAASDQNHSLPADRHQELRQILKQKKVSPRQAEEALLASGVLSGIPNEREAAADIVRKELPPPSWSSTQGAPSSAFIGGPQRTRSPSLSSAGGGSKTRALRDQFLGLSVAGFRRSLPPMSSSESHGPSHGSKVSERWRLKAMGIVQLPDGTAIPESLARDARYGIKSYASLGSTSTTSHRRRVSSTTGSQAGQMGHLKSPPAGCDEVDIDASTNKRKRTAEDDGEAVQGGESQPGSHKRVVSDAEQLIHELREMREEMEEGASWFRAQNERLHGEIASKGSTPWEGSL